jgi:C1A family cysteine protease
MSIMMQARGNERNRGATNMPMRILVFVVLSLSFINPMSAQTPGEAPRDSAFTKYTQERSEGKWRGMTDDGHGLGYIPSPVKFHTQPPARPPLRKVAYPSSYDLRTQEKVTSVKDQGSCGSCWAFATMGSVESRWLVNGYGTYDLSENNLKDCHGFLWGCSDGGNEEMATAYLSRDSGPISESADPYVDYDVPCTSGLTPVAYETDAYFLPNDANTIKDFILNYGGVYTTMHMEYPSKYYNASNYTYYYNGTRSSNHAVVIVGWNDNKTTAGGPGAWIIKNSWGTSWGESGYFYVSYNDKKILSSNAFWPNRIDQNSTAVIYEYDDLGCVGAFTWGTGSGYGLVKFIASGPQKITKIATWIFESNSTVSFWIYDDFNGTTLSNQLGSLTGQSCPYAGYYSFDLPTPIDINTGNDFYIEVKHTTTNTGTVYPVPIEYAVGGYSAPTIETGKCWTSPDGSSSSWDPLGGGTGYPWDLCIRAYAIPTILADVKVLLEGPYSSGSMSTALSSVLPTNQPYNSGPWNYQGTEQVGSIPPGVVDWVLVQLRTGTPPTMTTIATRAAFVKSNGSVVDMNGTSHVSFDGVATGSYYIVVRHRNHLAIMSASAVDFTSGSASYSFTTGQSQAYGTNPVIDLGSGKYGMCAGDANQDGQITSLDFDIFLPKFRSGATGYESSDWNLDGQVTSPDFDLYLPNFRSGTQTFVP